MTLLLLIVLLVLLVLVLVLVLLVLVLVLVLVLLVLLLFFFFFSLIKHLCSATSIRGAPDPDQYLHWQIVRISCAYGTDEIILLKSVACLPVTAEFTTVSQCFGAI